MTHPDTLQRAAFEAWYDSGAENRDEFMALVDAALQPQAADHIVDANKMAAAEPVAYQFRMRADWVADWGMWSPCNKEHHEMYIRAPKLHDWHYETRALYTSPPDPGGLLRDALSNLNDLADQKNAEIDALKEAMRLALEALQLVPALIQYQFTGDRDAMNALQNASNACEAAIAALEGMVNRV